MNKPNDNISFVLLTLQVMVNPFFSVGLASNVPVSTMLGATKGEKNTYYSNMVVRVLLERDARKAKVTSSLKGLFVKNDEGHSWKKFPKEIQLSLRKVEGKPHIQLNGLDIKAKELFLRAGTHYSDRVKYGERYYRGALKILLGEVGFTVTNVIPLDEYLAGTLAAEMNGSWEAEVLKAQAVASRTYALYMIRHPKSSSFDLDNSTQDQVYGGSEKESRKIGEVISSTAGLFLTYKGEPIKAYFHSRCGGTTETAGNVWNFKNHAFNTHVPCPYCRKQPYRWLASISTKELFHSLSLPFASQKELSSLSSEKTASGRVSVLKFILSGIEKKISSEELRSLLGYSRIKSANFDWKVDKERILFEGKGNGHGVGMCQWGARYLAQQGKKFDEILSYYYPGMKIEKLD